MAKGSSAARHQPLTDKRALKQAIKEFHDVEKKRLKIEPGQQFDYVTTNYQIASRNRIGAVTREELDEQNKVLETLAETSKHLAVETNIITILERIAESVATSLGVKKVNFWGYTEDKQGCYIIAAYGLQDQYIANSRDNPMPLGEGWIGRAMQTGQAWATSDVQKDPLLPKSWLPAAKKQDYHGLLCVPLMHGDEIIGGMCLYHEAKHEWKFFEYEVMTIVGNQAATALVNARAFEELSKERNKTTSIINSLEDGLILFDKNDTVLLTNPRAKALLEIEDIALTGKTIDETFVSGDRNLRHLLRIKNLPLRDHETQEIEIQTSRSLALKITKVPVRNERGLSFGTVFLMHDTTQEREIELMKSNFVSVASHQIRTPLTGIRWVVDTLRQEEVGELNEHQLNLLNNVSEVTGHFAALVDDLLDVSRIDEGRLEFVFEPSDLATLVETIVHNLRPVADARDIEFTLSIAENLPNVRMDSSKMDIAIQNLVDNALKYTKEHEGLVQVSVTASEQKVRIDVVDNGIGVPDEQKPFLFNKFFRAKNAVRTVPNGSGLGLYISKQIVEKHKGALTFVSTENQGSTFSIELPLN